MDRKKTILGVVIILTILLTFSISQASSSTLNITPSSTQSVQQTTEQIRKAVLDAVASNDGYIQSKLVTNLQVSDIMISGDQRWATAWVVYYDPVVEAMLPTEPALAVTQLVNDQWQVYLSSDPNWQSVLYSTPDDLLTIDEKDMWAVMNQGNQEPQAAQGGYFLPWKGGSTAYLSRSVGHDADFSTAHYAFDFFLPGTTNCSNGGQLASGTQGLNFNLHAAKAGTVWGWDDSVEDCNHNKVNFIVIRNTDDPTKFQLYMHLSQSSIPDALKTIGAPVAKGQFIAIADNTGISTGSHLHFQVENQPTWPAGNPYWNTALDITFDDVDINGGRPRSNYIDPNYCKNDDVCDVFRNTYASGNYYMGDATPPTGVLNGVSDGQTISTSSITLSGSGSDEQSGLNYGQLRANFGGSWHDLGGRFKPDFTYNWNLCDSALPVEDGQVSVALLLYDNAGNPAPLMGLKTFIKNFPCPSPPPACIPAADQVTLFEDSYYKGGCVKLNIGNYSTANSLNPLGNNDADSVLVGDGVIATLYSDENFTGHSQAFTTDTAFIKYQWVDSNALSSMKVATSASKPGVPILVSPLASTQFREGDILQFSWLNGGGAIDYQVEISDTYSVTTIPWQMSPIASVGSLPQGNYTWRVQGRNANGTSVWSAVSSFSIESQNIIPGESTVPYSDTMETSEALWLRNGLWNYVNTADKSYSGSHSWWYQNQLGNYDNSQPNSGSLTSPRIFISGPGYYLRFYYRYETETQAVKWDQRWVQISVDNGPFTNLEQLSNDPPISETSSWLRSKAIDLSEYAEHRIRIRFQFSTLDAAENYFSGWGIDNFSITSTVPGSCTIQNRDDDEVKNAFLLTYNSSIVVTSEICPNGDFDYYYFYGAAGDRIAVDVNAKSDGSLLDAYLYLLDSDGETVLAENDDEVFASFRDPLLNFTLPKEGKYYIKIRAWKHPHVGGDDNFYSLRLFKDQTNPVAVVTSPTSNIYLPDAPINIKTNISDAENNINRVEFYWHSTDWAPGKWELINTDRDSTDGWNYVFNPAGQLEGKHVAIFVKAYDYAGNFAGAGAWNLGIDKTAPVTTMKALESIQSSNAFLLDWTANDNLSGIDYFEIQEKVGQADWTTLQRIDGTLNELWIIGNPGTTYAYRMHGVDYSGNSENYPSGLEASTTIQTLADLCDPMDSYDTAGDDNSPANANEITVDGETQVHNYCNPLSSDFKNDEDWIKFSVTQGEKYIIRSFANSEQTATIMRLYALDGVTLIEESVPLKFGDSTFLVWIADRAGDIYLQLRHLNGQVIGTGTSTTVSITTAQTNFLPIIDR